MIKYVLCALFLCKLFKPVNSFEWNNVFHFTSWFKAAKIKIEVAFRLFNDK